MVASLRALLTAVAVALALAPTAFAHTDPTCDRTWGGSTGNWNDRSKWVGGSAPNGNERGCFPAESLHGHILGRDDDRQGRDDRLAEKRARSSPRLGPLSHSRSDSDTLPACGKRNRLAFARLPILWLLSAADRSTTWLHRQRRNPEFEGLLSDVKASGVPRLADAVFLLVDMSGDFADQLMAAIEKTRGKTAGDGKRHSFVTLSDGAESGVTFVSMRGDLRRLQEAVLSYARARKFASKGKTWLGLGARPESPSAAEIVAFNNDPWRQDPSLDRLTKVTMRPGTYVNPKRKYGRNEPCYAPNSRYPVSAALRIRR